MAKAKPNENKEREERIAMEIIVDAYSPEEQAMGWYYSVTRQHKLSKWLKTGIIGCRWVISLANLC